MKRSLVTLMVFALVVSSSTMSSAQEAQVSIATQQDQVDSARAEIHELQQKLADARTKRNGAVILGLSAVAVSVVGGCFSVAAFKLLSSVSGGLRGTFGTLGTAATVISLGAGYGAYKSFRWYEVKAEEVGLLSQQLDKAAAELDADARALEAAQ